MKEFIHLRQPTFGGQASAVAKGYGRTRWRDREYRGQNINPLKPEMTPQKLQRYFTGCVINYYKSMTPPQASGVFKNQSNLLVVYSS